MFKILCGLADTQSEGKQYASLSIAGTVYTGNNCIVEVLLVLLRLLFQYLRLERLGLESRVLETFFLESLGLVSAINRTVSFTVHLCQYHV